MARRARTRNDGVASVHERESEAPVAPAPDDAPLALLQEIAVAPPHGPGTRQRSVIADWRRHPFRLTDLPDVVPDSGSGRIRLRLESEPGLPRLEKTLEIRGDGRIEATLDWSAADLPEGSLVATRLPLAHPLQIEPLVTEGVSRTPRESHTRIVTLARSERGFEEIDQGKLVELAWPAAVGGAGVRLNPERDPCAAGGAE